jgi:hypothetical protein
VAVNGHVEATTEPYDMKLQRMVGHLPALLHPNPKSVLGIGFGAGVLGGLPISRSDILHRNAILVLLRWPIARHTFRYSELSKMICGFQNTMLSKFQPPALALAIKLQT